MATCHKSVWKLDCISPSTLPVGFRCNGPRRRVSQGIWKGNYHLSLICGVPCGTWPGLPLQHGPPPSFTNSDLGVGWGGVSSSTVQEHPSPQVTGTTMSHSRAHVWGAACPLPHFIALSLPASEQPHQSCVTRCPTACGQITATNPCISHTHTLGESASLPELWWTLAQTCSGTHRWITWEGEGWQIAI